MACMRKKEDGVDGHASIAERRGHSSPNQNIPFQPTASVNGHLRILTVHVEHSWELMKWRRSGLCSNSGASSRLHMQSYAGLQGTGR
jgi:hypothetical protein